MHRPTRFVASLKEAGKQALPLFNNEPSRPVDECFQRIYQDKLTTQESVLLSYFMAHINNTDFLLFRCHQYW